MKKLIYMSTVNTLGCQYELWCNDIIVHQLKGGENVTHTTSWQTHPPLNAAILKDGEYTVTLKLFPKCGKQIFKEQIMEKVAAALDIYVIDQDNWQEETYILKLKTPWNGLMEKIELPYYELKGTFKAEGLPFEIEGWTNSVDLSEWNEDTLLEEVFVYYKQLYTILEVGDASKYLEITKERDDLLATALYYNETLKQRDNDALVELFKEKALDLQPLNINEMKLVIMGHGKLVSLQRLDGMPALHFKAPNNKGEVKMEIKLHMRSKEKGFSII